MINNFMDDILSGYLKDGEKLKAVKYVMDKTGSGLKEAKEYVDSHYDTLPELKAPRYGCKTENGKKIFYKYENGQEFEIKRDDVPEKMLEALEKAEKERNEKKPDINNNVFAKDKNQAFGFAKNKYTTAEEISQYSIMLINGETKFYKNIDGKRTEVKKEDIPQGMLDALEQFNASSKRSANNGVYTQKMNGFENKKTAQKAESFGGSAYDRGNAFDWDAQENDDKSRNIIIVAVMLILIAVVIGAAVFMLSS